jgi:hypothetical protein
MCPHPTMCPHTATYVSSYCHMCVLILLYVSAYCYMCPHTPIYVSSYSYMCVLILLCMCVLMLLCSVDIHLLLQRLLLSTQQQAASQYAAYSSMLRRYTCIHLHSSTLHIPYCRCKSTLHCSSSRLHSSTLHIAVCNSSMQRRYTCCYVDTPAAMQRRYTPAAGAPAVPYAAAGCIAVRRI